MAMISYELPETYASVTRPVAYEIVKQLRDNLGILNKDIPISFPGANGKVTTWNANNVESRDSAQFQGSEKIIVDIREDYIEDDLLTMLSNRIDSPPIFLDKDHGIGIHTVYSRTKITISFTYRARDRWQAESFRDYWRRKIAENREYMVFNARYQYPIPEDIEKGLYLLYKTRSYHKQDYPTYQDYLFGLGSQHLVSLTNSAGKGDTLAMTECQENIYGNFTDPTTMDKEKDEIGAVWTCQFDYEYHYDKPISVVLTYPLLLNNKMVPPQLYPEIHFDINRLKLRSGLTRQNYTIIAQDNGFNWHIRGAYIRIPEFDDWSNQLKRNDVKTLLSAMLIVDPDKPKEVCNLIDLGDWGLHPALHESFKKQHRWLGMRNEFPFHVALYNGDVYQGDTALHFDYDLNVETKYDMSIENMYHMVITVVRDIKLLSPDAQKRFFNDYQLVCTYLDLILGREPHGGYPVQNQDGSVSWKEFDRIARLNNLGEKGRYMGLGSAIVTVGIFGVVTHHESELNEIGVN